MADNFIYGEHSNWYNEMLAAHIKTEPGTTTECSSNLQQIPAAPLPDLSSTHYVNFLKKQQQFSAMDNKSNDNIPSSSSSQHTRTSNGKTEKLLDTGGVHQQLLQQQKFQQHFLQAQQAAAQNQATAHLALGFNPLTPPGLLQVFLPSQVYNEPSQQQQQHSPRTVVENSIKSGLTPRYTPPMDITPPSSTKATTNLDPNSQQQDQEVMSSHSGEDRKYIADSEEDESIRNPSYNSHGKMKNYKCKTCGWTAITKLEFWEHSKTHMNPERIMHCTKCPFVTELKHHLEYHNRKHKNLKPFQCDKCPYTCVNKSMLNSHSKSHSRVYQFHCADCDHVAKHCHSFKLHLRSKKHKPGLILDENGVPDPSKFIDVHGNKRGPKKKGSRSASNRNNSDLKLPEGSQLPAALQSLPLNTQNQLPASPSNSSSVGCEQPALTLHFSQKQTEMNMPSQNCPSQQPQNAIQNDTIFNGLDPTALIPYWNFNFQMLAAHQHALAFSKFSPHILQQYKYYENNHINIRGTNNSEDEDGDDNEDSDNKSVDSAMNLSSKDDQQHQTPALAMNLKLAEENIETPLFATSAANRRKGRVLKLDNAQVRTNQACSAPISPHEGKMSTASSPIPPHKIDCHSSADESTASGQSNQKNTSNTNSSSTKTSPPATPTMFECKYCDMFFKDAVLYTIHMGYHSCDDVFKCNMCGEKCHTAVGLFVHMARIAHS